MNSKIAIYIVTHQIADLPASDHFVPIQAGRGINPKLAMLGDETGDNISAKNPYYAEITPMYWVWKNATLPDHVGFFHYRRFLNFGKEYPEKLHWSEKVFTDFSQRTHAKFGWDSRTLSKKVTPYDIVTPKREEVLQPPSWDKPTTLYAHYDCLHHIHDLELALEAIEKYYPKYRTVANEVIDDCMACFCHMYVMKKSVFADYMLWLTTVLGYVEENIDLDSPIYAKETGNQRVFGFLGERLFNIYVEYHKRAGLKVGEYQRLFGKFSEVQASQLVLGAKHE